MKLLKRLKLPQWYLYGAIAVLFVQAFIPVLADKLWITGCYLVAGAVTLILRK